MNARQKRENAHRTLIAVVAWVSWIGATLITAFAITDNLSRPYTAAVVLLVGAAIAAGQSLHRTRLSQTMTEVFLAGMQAERNRHEESGEEP